MNDSSCDISLARAGDLDGVAALLAANSPSRGGTLAVDFTPERVAQMLARGAPVVVARRAGRVVGVLFSCAREDAVAPVMLAMLAAWPGREDAYVYGPVCIADGERGRGLLARMYGVLRLHYGDREAVLFVRRDNQPSLHAHQRLGMAEVAGFTLEGVDYVVYSDAAPGRGRGRERVPS